METLKFGFRYWKKYLIVAIFIQLLSFVAIVADLFLPLISEIFVDYVIMDHEVTNQGVFSFLLSGTYGKVHTFELFFHVAAVFGSLILVRIILIYIKNITLQHLGLKLETTLRMETFKKLMQLDSQTISEYNTGELLQTIHGDTIMFKEMFCRMIPNFLDSVFVLISSVWLLSSINIRFVIFPILLLPFLAIALLKFRVLAKENYQRIRQSNSEMTLTVQENISAVRLVRSFTNESLEKEKFNRSNEQLRSSHIKQIWLSTKFDVLFGSMKQIAYIGTIAVGALLVMRGHLLVGFLVTCSSYVLKIMDHITQINNMLFQMQQQIVAGVKMKNFMECESRITDGEGKSIMSKRPSIEISHASLELDGVPVLKDVSVQIPYGKKLGIVGGTGSGKSILLKTLVRIHDLSAGVIKVDGMDIRYYNLHTLRETYSYVFQDVFLFSNTVDSNIAYGVPEAELEQVIKAAKHAQAHDFIKSLPDGYDTIVGERGLGMSGGQKQRVSIARALIKHAPILVFDDSTSALDVNTEKELMSSIGKNYPEQTVVITAHRMSSVVDCDEIIYMQDGAIVERGSFEELLALNGHFAAVYQAQKAEEKSVMNYDAEVAGNGV